MLNRVQMIGNLGADPEVITPASGHRIVRLRVAVNERRKDRDGNPKDFVEWMNVVIFNEVLVKVAEDHLRKGSQVYVEGQFQTRKWTDQAGNERYTTEVVLGNYNSKLVAFGRGNTAVDEPRRTANAPQPRTPQKGWDDADYPSDEIPF